MRAFCLAFVLLLTVGLTFSASIPDGAFPKLFSRSLGSSQCLKESLPSIEALIKSTDMFERTASTYLALPFDAIADYILNPSLLATWNGDYSNGGPQTSLPLCGKLQATFTTKINVTIPSGYSFRPPVILTVNRTKEVAVFGWKFGVSSADGKTDLYFGAHWIGVFKTQVNGVEATQFVSWQKIFGDFVAKNRNAFEYGLSRTVLQKDLVGALCLDQVYSLTGSLEVPVVTQYCGNNQN